MAIMSGIDALKKRMEEANKARQGNAVQQMEIKLKDKEILRLRIFTEAKDIKTALFHRIPRQTARGKTFTDDVLCLAPEPCKWDNDANPELRGVKAKMFVWVYAYYQLHTTKDKPEWTEVNQYGTTYYKEEINAPRYLKTGEGWGGYIVNKFLQYTGRYNTLCDRDYEWVRQGATQSDTVYDLLPEDPSPLADSIKKIMAAVPTLEQVIKGDFGNVPAASPQASAQLPAAIPAAPAPAPKPAEPSLLERLRKEKGNK